MRWIYNDTLSPYALWSLLPGRFYVAIGVLYVDCLSFLGVDTGGGFCSAWLFVFHFLARFC
jgi:hypothetical protein